MNQINFRDEDKGNSFEERQAYVKRHGREIKEKLQKVSEENLLEAYHLLNRWIWDERLLGPYSGALEAVAYFDVIREMLGAFKPLKYYHLKILHKTEEEFYRWCIEKLINYVFN